MVPSLQEELSADATCTVAQIIRYETDDKLQWHRWQGISGRLSDCLGIIAVASRWLTSPSTWLAVSRDLFLLSVCLLWSVLWLSGCVRFYMSGFMCLFASLSLYYVSLIFLLCLSVFCLGSGCFYVFIWIDYLRLPCNLLYFYLFYVSFPSLFLALRLFVLCLCLPCILLFVFMFFCVFCFFSFIWIFWPVSVFCYTSVSCLYLGLLSMLVLSFVLIHFKCLIDFFVSLCVYVRMCLAGIPSPANTLSPCSLIFLSYEEGCFKRATRKTKTREIKVKERNKNGTWIKKTNHWKRIIGTEAKTNWKGNETAP